MDTPAALFVGTPGADLTGTGDTFSTNQGVDRHIPTAVGFIDAAVRLYAGDLDVADPRISPIYGDFNGFPPTLLVSGTRDLFLSNTVRTHTKLRQAGTEADLLVYEGMSHADYLHVPTAPESLHFYEELNEFLVRHLRAAARGSTVSLRSAVLKRSRDPRARRCRPHQPRDRRTALPGGKDREALHDQHLAEAPRPQPR